MEWELVPCLERLRDEVNTIAPKRDKSSDGTIGDQAHQDRTSDHNADEVGKVPITDADSKNEVHGLDLDATLNTPGLTMEMIIQHTLTRCRKDNDDPANEPRLRYMIFNKRIWEAPDWRQENYTGDNPHTEHAHFSAEYVTSLEADTSSWHLGDLVALTDDDKKWMTSEIRKQITDALTGALGDVVVRRNPDGTKIGGDNPTMTIASAHEYGTHYAESARYLLANDVVPALERIESTLERIETTPAPSTDPPTV
jgi:hypothetical protein